MGLFRCRIEQAWRRGVKWQCGSVRQMYQTVVQPQPFGAFRHCRGNRGTRDIRGVLYDLIERSVLSDKRGGCLGADAAHARNVVRGVSDKGFVVRIPLRRQ